MARTSKSDGFSLVELLIAMVVTLIVGTAVFGLLTSGQSTFRVQPEVTDRQQNIRAAMDRIMRDVQNAGTGIPPISQVFSPGLDGVGPPSQDNIATDALEMLSDANGQDNEPACNAKALPGSDPHVWLKRNGTHIPVGTTVMILMSDPERTWSMRTVTGSSPSPVPALNGGDCAGFTHDQLDFAPGSGKNPAGSVCDLTTDGKGTVPVGAASCTPVALVFTDLVRYEIRLDAKNVPSLVRIAASEGGVPQVVARGIEDMQVSYKPASVAAFASDDPSYLQPQPPVVTPSATDNTLPDFDTVTAQVEVRLSSRVADLEGTHDPGATMAADGTLAIRGQLVSRVAPRAALTATFQEFSSYATGVYPRWQ